MLTLNSAMLGASQYALVGRSATVNAVFATATAIAAALHTATNEPTNPAEARKAVYAFLMDQGADKSTAALYRDAGALVYRALAAKYPDTLALAVASDEVGAAVKGLVAAVKADQPGACADRTTVQDWAKSVLGIRKAEKAEKTILERLQSMIDKADGFTSSEAAGICKYLANRLDVTTVQDVKAGLVARETTLAAEAVSAEAHKVAAALVAEAFRKAQDGEADAMLNLKVA